MRLFPLSATRHDRMRLMIWAIVAILAAEILWFAIG
jgi:hypothetical protein